MLKISLKNLNIIHNNLMLIYWVWRRKNALLIQFGVEVVWGNVDSTNGSWDAYLASPADFAGADDIITNLAKEREPGIEIVTSSALPYLWL